MLDSSKLWFNMKFMADVPSFKDLPEYHEQGELRMTSDTNILYESDGWE